MQAQEPLPWLLHAFPHSGASSSLLLRKRDSIQGGVNADDPDDDDDADDDARCPLFCLSSLNFRSWSAAGTFAQRNSIRKTLSEKHLPPPSTT